MLIHARTTRVTTSMTTSMYTMLVHMSSHRTTSMQTGQRPFAAQTLVSGSLDVDAVSLCSDEVKLRQNLDALLDELVLSWGYMK